MVSAQQIYDLIADHYDEKYVDDKSSSFMYDEQMASEHFWRMNYDPTLKFISLGCGTGQDFEICHHPPHFTGYDISSQMLLKARKKFPHVDFFYHDCNEMLPSVNADVVVSMFGTPNYIGPRKLLEHYSHLAASHAFFVFYNEFYNDGVIDIYHKTDLLTLWRVFGDQPAVMVKELFTGSNYYVVAW